MKQINKFVISEFTNPSGEIVFRVSGWQDGKRVRKNFSTRAEAQAERQVLELGELQAESGMHAAATRPADEQLDGFQTCVALLTQARERGRTLPVWLMTAGFSSAAERRALEVGAIRLLSKPFNHEDLISDMERHFSEPRKPSMPSTSGTPSLQSDDANSASASC